MWLLYASRREDWTAEHLHGARSRGHMEEAAPKFRADHPQRIELLGLLNL